MALQRLGVQGKTLPTKKSKVVTASDFTIAGVIGQFERKFEIAFPVTSTEDKKAIFGDNIISGNYGSDAVDLFFTNLDGTPGKLYIKSHVGYTGAAIDAITASAALVDQAGAPLTTLTLQDGYKGNLGFGVSGNRTGYTITNGLRVTTAIGVSSLSTDTFIYVDSASKIYVGDIIKIDLTDAGAETVYKKVTAKDETSGKVSFTGALHASKNATVDDVVAVLGFQLKLYRQDINGIVNEIEVNSGAVWCTMSPEVTDFYVQNVFADSNWLIVTDAGSTSLLNEKFPVDVSTITYLTSGADGTVPTTSSHWDVNLGAFDGLPIRILCNTETVLDTVNKSGEEYCNARDDKPKWIYNLPENQSKSQLITIGQNYQRSDEVSGVMVSNWLQIVDPFANSALAPYRTVPNVAAIMGLWIRSINVNGIHFIPAVPQMPLKGIQGIIEAESNIDDIDRTDLGDAGINIIQALSTGGFIVRNFFTPSTTAEFQYANGPLMKSFLIVSFKDSLADTENEPNTIDRIRISSSAITAFYYRLWFQGSTGNVPEGETFGRFEKEDGSTSVPADSFQVKADFTNNPLIDVQAGIRRLDSWFRSTTPAGTIIIGVGFIY